MRVNYKPFVDRMIQRYEGPYGWDKNDPGGPTKYGITCYDLAEHRGQKMTSMAVWAPIVQAMSLFEAEDIYRAKYATGIQFDALASGCDCVMMDYGVNSGVSRPILVARRLLGVDAIPTSQLVQMINKSDPHWFINAMCDERLHFMHGIRNGTAWAEYHGGWQSRLDDLRKLSNHLADGAATLPEAPDLSKVPTPKATHDDPKLTQKTTTVAGGAVGTGGAAWTAGVPAEIALGVAIVGGAAAIGYLIYKRNQALKLNSTVILPPGVEVRKAA